MKPLRMDKNRVLVYEGDIVLYRGKKYIAYESELTGGFMLMPCFGEFLVAPGTIDWIDNTIAGAFEVVNVSDRTNYDRYFADLCSQDEALYYICHGVYCSDCIVNGSICTMDSILYAWLREPAVKL